MTTINMTCKHGHDELALGTMCQKCEGEKAEAESNARQEAYRAKVKAEREALELKFDVVRKAIVAAVVDKGMAAALVDHKVVVLGIDVSWFIEFREQLTGSSYHRRVTGHYNLSIGDYGNRTNFPQKKDGTYSYDKIAEKLIGIAGHKIKAAELEKARQLNKNVVADFCTENKVQEYGAFNVEASQSSEKPLFIRFKIERAMTIEQAKALHEGLVKLGVIQLAK